MTLAQLLRRRATFALALCCAWAVCGGAWAGTPAAAPAAAVESASSPPSTADAAQPAQAASAPAFPRILREPLPPMYQSAPPTVPEVFTGYPGAMPYTVVPRKPELPLFPCSMCHDLQKLNTKVRQFLPPVPPNGAPHAGVLRHGKGRLWCLDCHMPKPREFLRSLSGARIDFDDSPQLCGQCHSARHRDWTFGGHGKRVANWTGERQLYACTHCHDPHVPVIKPLKASKPPPLRVGLQPMAGVRAHTVMPWQRDKEGAAHGSQEKN